MYEYSLSEDGQELALTNNSQTTRFHAIWLRDNAQDENTRSTVNGQKLITINELSRDLKIEHIVIEKETAKITFSPTGEKINYNLGWLVQNSYDKQHTQSALVDANIETWNATIAQSILNEDFHTIQQDSSKLKDWLGQVAKLGFARLRNGPIENEALYRVVDLFGYVRETNYGRHFEVRTEVNATNLAYTGMALQAHTDNPYRDPVPSLQILYCLESSAEGGENMVVDGFRVAERLRAENKAWFDVLSRYSAQFEYKGANGVCLQASHPAIEITPDNKLKAIHFNNRSAATLTSVPFDQMQTYYDAYRRMSELVNDPDMEVRFRLEPGECFIVDNTRVLHARAAYSGTGKRWLQGCYADKDGLQSTLACLESSSADQPI